MPAKQARNWCATFFTEPPDKEPDHVRYAIYGKENATTTEKEHWQSYLEFDKRMTMTGVKKLYKDKTIHLEIRNGTREQARDYCKKDGAFEEFGDWDAGGQGTRTDIKAFVDELKSGKTLKEVAMDNPTRYCSNRNGLRDIAGWILKDNIEDWRTVHVSLFYGSTGKGKTRTAMAAAPDVFKVSFNSGPEWWCGYDGEKTICIDDYNNDMKINRLLVLLDGSMCRLPIKGGQTWAQWDTVYITTNLTMDQLHGRALDSHRRALFRRINVLRDFDVYPWVETQPQKDITGFCPREKRDIEQNNSNINTKDLMMQVDEMDFGQIESGENDNNNSNKNKGGKADGLWMGG